MDFGLGLVNEWFKQVKTSNMYGKECKGQGKKICHETQAKDMMLPFFSFLFSVNRDERVKQMQCSNFSASYK